MDLNKYAKITVSKEAKADLIKDLIPYIPPLPLADATKSYILSVKHVIHQVSQQLRILN